MKEARPRRIYPTRKPPQRLRQKTTETDAMRPTKQMRRSYRYDSDRKGLDAAYLSPDGIVIDGDRMYIAGTKTMKDWIQDLYIPLRKVEKHSRYKAASSKMSPAIREVVGHSLGGAVVAKLIEDRSDLHGRAYNAPLARVRPTQNMEHYANVFDPASVLDFRANRSFTLGQPHSYGNLAEQSAGTHSQTAAASSGAR